MITKNSNNLKKGTKILINSEPYIIESSEFVKPGKGQAFIRMKLKNLISEKLLDKTCKSTDTFHIAEVITTSALYLYKDVDNYFFMEKKSFEQFSLKKNVLKKHQKWLIEQNEYLVNIWNNKIISIVPNNFIISKIIKINNNIKGNSVTSSTNLAILSTGAVIKIPLFIKIGELIKVDTRSGEYVCRVKSI
ncbi:elongation factor P [Buchnera aphidicola (Thelaxes californica)]|uniref:Elongation factor P n=1 Tax=Buchnera aphidicola (Thelaxes californica) TaxID=1315998 RepID=A0A4D6Y9Y6_9GAMM|nr:elongation factor P [Buchnera aphidicola]QCI26577.1 elongation factor P [Buchnera aphidicola (Thelaxes californica)]